MIPDLGNCIRGYDCILYSYQIKTSTYTSSRGKIFSHIMYKKGAAITRPFFKSSKIILEIYPPENSGAGGRRDIGIRQLVYKCHQVILGARCIVHP